MKRVRITGSGSYIGNAILNRMQAQPEAYEAACIDMLTDDWKTQSFAGVDTVIHVAGLVHQKETSQNAAAYMQVNCTLALDVARKAKDEGVKQFIYFSTMSVYGMDTGVITKATQPQPTTQYGKSKLAAEAGLQALADERFRVCILRPPMVYGEGCRGNYQLLKKIITKFHVLPRVQNERSMIHIDNLVGFVCMAVEKQIDGICFPQNRYYVHTIDLSKEIAASCHTKVYFSYVLGWATVLLRPVVGKLRKGFGTLIYQDTEDFDFTYCVR